ncbi:Protein of unknown function [Fontimonas thermophila]|uniref:DUF1302 domain-containing protein n=2 Tax=Fontimonas thermophila TaxID=1076937 RepID=A0A1I2I8F7_9GAMM|nr:Protein of unknown function [Fontimonas thermophila]
MALGKPHIFRAGRRCGFALMAAVIAGGYSETGAALEFDIGGTTLRVENLVTIGAAMRMQDRDDALVGKSNLNPGLCVARDGDDGVSGPDPSGNNTFTGDTCSATRPSQDGNGTANDFFLRQPGGFQPNGDNGNLNFDKRDIVHATAKLTTDVNVDLFGFNVFARGIYFFDAQYEDMRERHPDTTLQPFRTAYPDAAIKTNGRDFEMLDYFVSRTFEVAERPVSIKIGNHVLNWGESGFLALNSLNTINPLNQALLRIPGFDIKELFLPVGMVNVNADVMDGLNVEVFYQYDWKPFVLDPVGSFFSSADILGAGASYAMLSFGKAPEDPLELYAPFRNPDDPAAVLGSRSDRTMARNFTEERRRRPDDGGQYGLSLKTYLEDLNNGTELAFYFANYHSRIPTVGIIAADATCLPDQSLGNPVTNLLSLFNPAGSCRVPPENLTALLAQQAGQEVTYMPRPEDANDALPVGSISYFAEYPEDIRVYGISFNTTLGDIAWSGEYAFRDNLPVQIHITDLVFAGLQPAFPANDFSLGVATLPGRRTAVPDFVSVYRGVSYGPGDYIRGYERMKVGQLGTTFIKTIGGDNPLGASQIVALLELGMTQVFDMPSIDELQFQGAGVNTHISSGADGSVGINPRDVRTDPNDPTTNGGTATLRQNPTAHPDRAGFGTEISYGYRLVTLTRYDDAIFGINFELLAALFHDVEGVAPGLGQNFVEGRKQILAGLRWDYLSRYTGEIRYTWYTGTHRRDAIHDRDYILAWVGYQF